MEWIDSLLHQRSFTGVLLALLVQFRGVLLALLVHLRQVHPLKAPPKVPLMILSAKLLQTADSTKQMQQKRRCPLRATP